MEKRGAVVLRNVGHGVNDLYWYMLPSILPLILEQFGLKYGAAGGLLTAYLGTIAIFSFILGKLSDYIPRHSVLGPGFLVASTFLIAAGLMSRFGTFILFLLIAGIGVSSFHPAIYASIEENTTWRLGTTYGMFEFWGAFAVFCMFFLHGLLLKKLGYQSIIVLTSVPGLILGSFYLRYSRLFISEKSNKESLNEKTHSSEALAYDASANKSSTYEAPAYLFIIFLIVITFRCLGMIAVINFTPTYLVKEVGLQKSLASYATGLYFVGALIFIPVIGKISDKWGPLPVLLAANGVACPLIFLLGISYPVWALPVYIVLMGGSFNGAWPVQNMIIARMSGKIGKGEAFGYYMAAISITSSLSPLIFGVAADRIGLKSSVMVFSIPVLISFLLLLILWRARSLREDA